MSLLPLLCTALAAIALDTAWVALFRAAPVGRFKLVRDAGGTLVLDSGGATVTISRSSRTLTVTAAGRQRAIRFEDIKGLEYRVQERYALLQELFFGYQLPDALVRYQDTVDWFSIGARTHDGQRLPLYLSGQYQPREFMLGWYIELQAALLSRLGLLADVEAHSREVLDLIQDRLDQPPLL